MLFRIIAVLGFCMLLTGCFSGGESDIVAVSDQEGIERYGKAYEDGKYQPIDVDRAEKVYTFVLIDGMFQPVDPLRALERDIPHVNRYLAAESSGAYDDYSAEEYYVVNNYSYSPYRNHNPDDEVSAFGVTWSPSRGYVESVRVNDSYNEGYLQRVGSGRASAGYLERVGDSGGAVGYLEQFGGGQGSTGYLEQFGNGGWTPGYLEQFGVGSGSDGYLEQFGRGADASGYLETYGTGFVSDGYLGQFGNGGWAPGYLETYGYGGTTYGYLEQFGEGGWPPAYLEQFGSGSTENETNTLGNLVSRGYVEQFGYGSVYDGNNLRTASGLTYSSIGDLRYTGLRNFGTEGYLENAGSVSP